MTPGQSEDSTCTVPAHTRQRLAERPRTCAPWPGRAGVPPVGQEAEAATLRMWVTITAPVGGSSSSTGAELRCRPEDHLTLPQRPAVAEPTEEVVEGHAGGLAEPHSPSRVRPAVRRLGGGRRRRPSPRLPWPPRRHGAVDGGRLTAASLRAPRAAESSTSTSPRRPSDEETHGVPRTRRAREPRNPRMSAGSRLLWNVARAAS